MNMKGKTRAQKGITLIALIITIVVLLILATVAITSMQESDIIGYTNNAASKYNGTVTNESGTLGEYENFLGNYSGGTGGESKQTLSTPTISISGNTLTITAVENATSYDVYVNGTVKTNTTSTTIDLTTLNLEEGEYNITVVAKAEGYTNSLVSNVVSYEKSAPTTPTIISFTIDGTTYQAEKGMKFKQWIVTDYNTGGFEVCTGTLNDEPCWFVHPVNNITRTFAELEEVIEANKAYESEKGFVHDVPSPGTPDLIL